LKILFLGLAGSLFLMGCASLPHDEKKTPKIPPEVVFVDEVLKKNLQVGALQSARSSNRLLSVQLAMANAGRQDLSLQAQTWYQDAQGNYLQTPEVREGAWTSFYLPGGQGTVYRSQSLHAGAEKFIIRIRLNPVGTTAPSQGTPDGMAPPPPGLFN
jgi:hypothetical protein